MPDRVSAQRFHPFSGSSGTSQRLCDSDRSETLSRCSPPSNGRLYHNNYLEKGFTETSAGSAFDGAALPRSQLLARVAAILSRGSRGSRWWEDRCEMRKRSWDIPRSRFN
jgi:hypothetical protein